MPILAFVPLFLVDFQLLLAVYSVQAVYTGSENLKKSRRIHVIITLRLSQ